MAFEYISAGAFKGLWTAAAEFAVIDPREEMIFARGHLFAATNMPLSRIEILIRKAVPLKGTSIVVCDDGDGLAERAAGVIAGLDYRSIKILEGGLPLWHLLGGSVFSGMHVPSKAFGEAVERDLHTPAITSQELRELLDSGKELLLLDARPLAEHAEACIPGSICCPSAEMILRASEREDFSDRQIVVHCAGRTRAIIGAQTLIDSGKFKSVRALRNGTPGWRFIGGQFEHGNTLEMKLPETASSTAREAGASIRKKWNIPSLDRDELAAWRGQASTHYLIDVRSSAEFDAGHLSGSQHVPGGQLIQTTEQHLVVQNSLICLIDNDDVRAVTCAMWLRRMGWQNVATYTIGADDKLETGAREECGIDEAYFVTAANAFTAQTKGTAVICDLRRSYEYRRAHIKGAAFLTRERLADDIRRLASATSIVLVADDLRFARLVRDDLVGLGRRVTVLRGGMPAWRAAGLPTESGPQMLLSRPVDTYLDPDYFDDPDVYVRECHAYLNWEIALIDYLDGDPAVRFELR